MKMMQETKNKEEIEDWLIDEIAKATKKEPDDIDITEQLVNYGINSVDAVNISGELEEWLGYEIPASIVYQFPSIEALSIHLSGEQNSD